MRGYGRAPKNQGKIIIGRGRGHKYIASGWCGCTLGTIGRSIQSVLYSTLVPISAISLPHSTHPVVRHTLLLSDAHPVPLRWNFSLTGSKSESNPTSNKNLSLLLTSTLRPLSGPLYPKLSTSFEGAWLTQLVQLVTADRLFPCHEGRVDP